MRKLRRILNFDAGPANISLSDLHEVVDALHDLPNCGKLTISVDDYELSDLSEVSELKQKIVHKLNLEYVDDLSETMYSLCISETSAKVACSEDDPYLRTIGTRTSELLRVHQNKWQWTAKAAIVSNELGKLGLLLLGLGFLLSVQSLLFLGLLVSLIVVAGLLLYRTTSDIRKSKIMLLDKNPQTSFWMRNRETIAVAMITSLASTVLGAVGTIVVQALTK